MPKTTIPKAILVEDEAPLAESLTAYLQRDNFEVEWVADGAKVIERVKHIQPDFILLDLMLPNVDGISLCKEIRTFSYVPIIMITARIDEIDRLLGLELGADDYICKPFSPREVIARVRAVLRRYQLYSTESPGKDKCPAKLRLDADSMEVFWEETNLQLTAVEFRLIQTMMSEPRRVFSRDKLMQAIYEDHRVVNDRTIDSHITKLRKKFADADCQQDVIRSVYGAGYKFEMPI